MFFIEGKIVEVRPAAISETGRVDAGSLTNAMNAYFNCGTQRVITATDIIVVYFMIWVLARGRNSRHVYQSIASSKGIFHCRIISNVGLNMSDIGFALTVVRSNAINRYNTMSLSQCHLNDSLADTTQPTCHCDFHETFPLFA
jgi:hypothetical protein